MSRPVLRDERGIALIMALLLALLVASMAIGVLLMTSSTNLVAKFHSTEATMTNAAEAGLEWARDTLNGTPAILPATGFDTLELNQAVRDASNNVIPGFTRSVFAGPSGNTTGQYGVYASVISVVSDARGAVVVRRSQLKQDSFAKFARFFNTWSCCAWGPTETVQGPVHSNQGMALVNSPPGATFKGPVTTVSAISNQARGNWLGGVTTGTGVIPFPTVTTLAALQNFATIGQTNITGYGTLTATDPDTRVEFVAVDLNNDGDTADDNEGYFRVYHAKSGGSATVQQMRRNYVNARPAIANITFPGSPNGTSSTDPNLRSPNCGGLTDAVTPNQWLTADSIWKIAALTTNAQRAAKVRAALGSATRACYLGGDPRLWQTAAGVPQYVVGDTIGDFQTWPGWGGAPPAALVTYLTGKTLGASATTVASTFWPLSRNQNINFRGVIYVTGSVAVSGTLRGRVTLVATGNIMLPDDITYVQPPNTTCADILGLLTAKDAMVEDNSVNTPFRVNNNWTVAFDETPDETFHSFFLTLGNFGAENLSGDPAPAAPENCGNTSRGCKKINGGTIQQGVSGTYSGTTGWAEQDNYDNCGQIDPPPYYPTTGRFSKYKFYEIDPVGFSVAGWFAANQ